MKHQTDGKRSETAGKRKSELDMAFGKEIEEQYKNAEGQKKDRNKVGNGEEKINYDI